MTRKSKRAVERVHIEQVLIDEVEEKEKVPG
jgi:hypothetical protein